MASKAVREDTSERSGSVEGAIFLTPTKTILKKRVTAGQVLVGEVHGSPESSAARREHGDVDGGSTDESHVDNSTSSESCCRPQESTFSDTRTSSTEPSHTLGSLGSGNVTESRGHCDVASTEPADVESVGASAIAAMCRRVCKESQAQWNAHAECRQKEQPVRLLLGPGQQYLLQALSKIGENLGLDVGQELRVRGCRPRARESALAARALQYLA